MERSNKRAIFIFLTQEQKVWERQRLREKGREIVQACLKDHRTWPSWLGFNLHHCNFFSFFHFFFFLLFEHLYDCWCSVHGDHNSYLFPSFFQKRMSFFLLIFSLVLHCPFACFGYCYTFLVSCLSTIDIDLLSSAAKASIYLHWY